MRFLFFAKKKRRIVSKSQIFRRDTGTWLKSRDFDDFLYFCCKFCILFCYLYRTPNQKSMRQPVNFPIFDRNGEFVSCTIGDPKRKEVARNTTIAPKSCFELFFSAFCIWENFQEPNMVPTSSTIGGIGSVWCPKSPKLLHFSPMVADTRARKIWIPKKGDIDIHRSAPTG